LDCVLIAYTAKLSGFVSDSPTHQETEKSLNIEHLSEIITELTDIIRSRPNQETYTSVASILLNRHLIDIYAGLLQLAYAPFAAIEKELSELDKKEENESVDKPPLSPFQLNAPKIQIDRENFGERFQRLFERYFDHPICAGVPFDAYVYIYYI
jgi:hypothetical protein